MFRTTRLVSVILPMLRTVPVKVTRAPGINGTVGQSWTISTLGNVATVQEEYWTMSLSPQVSRPEAETMTEQELKGTV